MMREIVKNGWLVKEMFKKNFRWNEKWTVCSSLDQECQAKSRKSKIRSENKLGICEMSIKVMVDWAEWE